MSRDEECGVGREEGRADRLAGVAARPFSPGSLVGSFCHRHGGDGSDVSDVWQGVVVAEPAPGVFLVEWFDWVVGASSYQTLVPVGEMTGRWRFYDSAEWMANVYETYFAPRLRARERREERELAGRTVEPAVEPVEPAA